MRINKSQLISIVYSPLYILIDRFLKKKDKKKNNKKLLIIFLGYIGDYILFRNYIKEIKKDTKYKDYSITLCGDPLWKSISESSDKESVDSFIWINNKKFLTNPLYRFNILKKISKESFEVSVMPNYGRSFSVDSIFGISNSINKVGNNGSARTIFPWQKKISDKYYTRLIHLKKESEFEFLKNKDFFEQFLNKKLSTKLSLPFKKLKISKEYAVFLPGAGARFKKWHPKNFAKVADFLIKKYNLKVKISGSKKDYPLAKEIILNSKYPNKIENLTGKSLLESMDLIGNASLMISNETGPSHIAAATGTHTLCLSNGNEFGRFYPYPKKISKKIIHILPPELQNKKFGELIKEYHKVSTLDINSILPDKILDEIDKILD